MSEKIKINHELLFRCRQAAKVIADGIQELISGNTTISVERSVLRLLGIDGVDDTETPLPNVLVDEVNKGGKLNKGILYWLGNAILETGKTPQEIANAVGEGSICLLDYPENELNEVMKITDVLVSESICKINKIKEKRALMQEKFPLGRKPWLYVIVASGNIFEDVLQAKSAVRQGADIIAVIRSTAQSLLDYVPYGATTEGFGGTFATQENFRIMRKALDEISEEVGRYIMLVNYCSGLCMPEIASMGAIERLDMMLNDAMYGILFRDINMKRTFIDQYFSRMVNAFAGIIINTGEDNYLTTADAVDEAHTVIASQFINEELAKRSGLKDEQIGLGHAFEINPDLEDGFLFELAHAQLIRQIFPKANLKYMPPTKHMTGDIFRGLLVNGMYNLVSIVTGQDIHLLGMMTEAIHTPFLHDRSISISNAKYIFNNSRNLKNEFSFNSEGIIQKRTEHVLTETVEMLEKIAEKGLMKAIENKMFANISRSENGGKGLQGVIKKSENYYNPFIRFFKKELKI